MLNLNRTLRLRLNPPCFAIASTFTTNSPRDFYTVLGVPATATQREIKAAYYALSKKYHPDVAGASTEAKFVEINEAYEILRDPNKRRTYDNLRTGARGPRYTGDHGYNGDPFQEFYRRATQGQWQYTSQGARSGRRYSQAEYERIWQEFRRQAHASENNNSRWDNQKIWEDLARERAQRWQEFGRKYPNGPPGSWQWQWQWGPNGNNNSNEQPKSQYEKQVERREFLRKLAITYFVVFFAVCIFQVLLGLGSQGKPPSRREDPYANANGITSRTTRDQIDQMMHEIPGSQQNWQQNLYGEESALRAVNEPLRRPMQLHPPLDLQTNEISDAYPYGLPPTTQSFSK